MKYSSQQSTRLTKGELSRTAGVGEGREEKKHNQEGQRKETMAEGRKEFLTTRGALPMGCKIGQEVAMIMVLGLVAQVGGAKEEAKMALFGEYMRRGVAGLEKSRWRRRSSCQQKKRNYVARRDICGRQLLRIILQKRQGSMEDCSHRVPAREFHL